MARLCSGCNKFASISEDAEPEVSSEQVDGNTVSAQVEVKLESACCGETMATAELEWEYEITDSDHEHRDLQVKCSECSGDGDVQCEECSGSGTVHTDGTGLPLGEPAECEECQGSGNVQCMQCSGTGKVDADEDAWIGENGDLYELGTVSASFTSEQQTKDRHGKPIKNSRYMRMFYGAELEAEVTCLACDVAFTVTDSVLEQASSFNDY